MHSADIFTSRDGQILRTELWENPGFPPDIKNVEKAEFRFRIDIPDYDIVRLHWGWKVIHTRQFQRIQQLIKIALKWSGRGLNSFIRLNPIIQVIDCPDGWREKQSYLPDWQGYVEPLAVRKTTRGPMPSK